MDVIEQRIKNVMAVVFDVEPDTINETTSKDSVENWDSINQLNLITSLEEEFDIQIPFDEIGNMLNFQLVVMVVKEQLG